MDHETIELNESSMSTPKQYRKPIPSRLIISAAIFGIIFTVLFTKQYIGLNMMILVVLVYAFAIFNHKLFVKCRFHNDPWIYLFSLPVLFLGITLFTDESVINPLSIMVILIVLFSQYLVISGNALHDWYSPGFFIELVFGWVNRSLLSFGHFLIGAVENIFKKQSKAKKGAAVGILVGIMLLVIIVPLLMVADAETERILGQIFKNVQLGDAILYIFVFLISASVITGPIAVANREEFSGKRHVKPEERKRPVEQITTVIALSMVGVVYILFAIVQFGYFFMPQETITARLGLTSSAYAVRGFGELIFITCLNFLLIELSIRFTKKNQVKSSAYLKVLYTLLIVFNFIIMASAHIRMQCYENSYGYTVARFLSHSFMILLVVFNVIMLGRIYFCYKAGKFFVAVALVYYCIIAGLNPELFVTRQNIQRYYETGKIDAAYAFTLSGDAVSETCDFAEAYPQVFDADAKEQAKRRLKYYQRTHNENWQSLNIAESRAYDKLRCLLGNNP